MKTCQLPILVVIGVLIFAPLAPISIQAQDGNTVYLPSIGNGASDPTPIALSVTVEQAQNDEADGTLFLPNVQAKAEESMTADIPVPESEPPSARPVTDSTPSLPTVQANTYESMTTDIPDPASDPPAAQSVASSEPQTPPQIAGSGMPARPLPAHPIPHHEPGQPSRAMEYETEVIEVSAAGVEETVTLSGLDAMLADGVIDDPLQGNYRLLNLDKLMLASYDDTSKLTLQTYELMTTTLTSIPNSQVEVGNHRFYDIAAGDLNGDLVDEQITAWIGDGNQIYLSIGEMPGTRAESHQRLPSCPALTRSKWSSVATTMRCGITMEVTGSKQAVVCSPHRPSFPGLRVSLTCLPSVWMITWRPTIWSSGTDSGTVRNGPIGRHWTMVERAARRQFHVPCPHPSCRHRQSYLAAATSWTCSGVGLITPYAGVTSTERHGRHQRIWAVCSLPGRVRWPTMVSSMSLPAVRTKRCGISPMMAVVGNGNASFGPGCRLA